MGAGLRWLGALVLAGLRELGATLRLAQQVLRRRHELELRLALEQAYLLGNRSALFVVVVLGFTGAIMVIQASAQAQRILGDLSAIGPAFLQLMVREFGPTITALMVAARYGAGVGAELGAMTITEQVDALRLTGASPEGYLVGPRIAGGMIAGLPIAVLGTAVAWVAGGVAAHQVFGMGWDTYVNFQLVDVGDVAVGCAKAIAYGAAIPLVASRAGLRAHGGAPGVGQATTRAVIWGSTWVLGLDLLVGVVAFGLEGLG